MHNLRSLAMVDSLEGNLYAAAACIYALRQDILHKNYDKQQTIVSSEELDVSWAARWLPVFYVSLFRFKTSNIYF